MGITGWGYPGATSVFIPDHAGTAYLTTGFSRDPRTFKVGQWASYTPVTKPVAMYLRLNFDMCARFLGPRTGTNTAMPTIWPRGHDAPQLSWGLEAHQYTQITTQRHADGYTLDRDTANVAEWDIQAFHDAIYGQKAMTERAVLTIGRATDTTQYDASHVATATVWGGGFLNTGTSTNPVFKIALQTMYRQIFFDTRGSIQMSDMVVVLNPAVANVISQSPEITDFVKNNMYGYDQLKGELLQNWGLPGMYQGFRIVVDDTIYVPTETGAAGTGNMGPQPGFGAWPWATVAMFARPGALVSRAGGPSFSTVHIWLREDMAKETMDDVNNRKFTSRIVNDYDANVVAPVTGALMTASLASQPIASNFDLFLKPENETNEMVMREAARISKPYDFMEQTQKQFEHYQEQIEQYRLHVNRLEERRLQDWQEWKVQFEKLEKQYTSMTVNVPTAPPGSAPGGWETEKAEMSRREASMQAQIDALSAQIQALTKPAVDNGGSKKDKK